MKELNMAVVIKPVPDPAHYERIQIDSVTGILIRQGLSTVINPEDKHALEAALQLKETFGGRVILISMAPENAVETLKEGLAMGADEAHLCSDRSFAGADSLATSKVLANALQKLGPFDLVLAGSASADGGTAHVPSQVGELLGISHLTNVLHLEIGPDDKVLVRTKLENGYQEVKGSLPMVVGVRRKINSPRYTSLMGIMAAQGKAVQIWGLAELGLKPEEVGLLGSPTQPGRLTQPEIKRKGEVLSGDTIENAQRLIGIFRSAGILG
ncbi:MAG: electron transfer flavoprotein subunit beta/FixA family protein [Desulfitobacteriaceae bacterium]